LNSLLLEAGERVAVGHFAGLLAAERRANPSVWHPGVSPSIFFGVAVLAMSLKKFTVRTSLKKFSKKKGWIEVKLLGFESLENISKLSVHRARHSTKKRHLLALPIF
jgi:hypothetical protein